MRLYNITAFPNIRQPDNQIKLAYSWVNLCRFLGKQRKPVAKIRQGAWSPASFDGKRSNTNVTSLSCLVLDIDDSITFGQANVTLMVTNVRSYLHTSVSHDNNNDRFRIVIPTAEKIPGDEWTYYYLALESWFDETFGAFENATFDRSAKDAARAYYVGYHTMHFAEDFIEGKILDWKGRAQDAKEKYMIEMAKRRKEQEERLALAEKKKQNLGKHISASDQRKYMYEALRNDSSERRKFALWLGATIKGGESGERAVLWSCPRCGKNDCTFFYIDPTRYPSAYCNHRNNCNWKGSVGYLAEINCYTL